MSFGNIIKRLEKGQTPSLLDTNKGNEVIDAVNALQQIRVQRNGTQDFVLYSDNDVLINIQDFPVNEETTTDSDATGLAGFSELDVYFCVNGSAQKKTILVKDSQ